MVNIGACLLIISAFGRPGIAFTLHQIICFIYVASFMQTIKRCFDFALSQKIGEIDIVAYHCLL